jgi:hypothetical protein
VRALLLSLVGAPLPFRAFAYGPLESDNDACTLHFADASIVAIGAENGAVGLSGAETGSALLVELVADRFLRRMVRIMVATLVRHALERPDLDDDGASASLMAALLAGDRSIAAAPAPPMGLALLGVGYRRELRGRTVSSESP